ncbi:MAG: NUDIX hydrolase [Firmicutes bacterium]|nr:NUDIX hydrolase [Bacillota bacterium]
MAPGVWNVPAGKVKYDEIPAKAVIRECREELGLEVKIIREIGCQAFKTKVWDEDAYRLVFTYLVEIAENDSARITLNEEHSEYTWVNRDQIEDEAYSSLMGQLKRIIIENNVF